MPGFGVTEYNNLYTTFRDWTLESRTLIDTPLGETSQGEEFQTIVLQNPLKVSQHNVLGISTHNSVKTIPIAVYHDRVHACLVSLSYIVFKD